MAQLIATLDLIFLQGEVKRILVARTIVNPVANKRFFSHFKVRSTNIRCRIKALVSIIHMIFSI